MPDSRADVTVNHFLDSLGHDCYRICLPNGICSIVSSAHLIEERITQLLKAYT